jgi:hypothetical protein
MAFYVNAHSYIQKKVIMPVGNYFTALAKPQDHNHDEN